MGFNTFKKLFRPRVAGIVLFCIIVLEGAIFLRDDLRLSRFQTLSISHFFSDTPLERLAQSVLAKCSNVEYRPSCYDEEIPKLMDTISMEDAFGVTRIITDKDPTYAHCHVLAHRLSAREAAKDLSRWKDVITRCPTAECNNGCLHGSLMQRFNNVAEAFSDEQIAEIKPDLEEVCEPRGDWQPVEVEQTMCYHSLGHLFIYITHADMERSLKLCEEIGTKDDGRNYIQTCTEGVFMSVFQWLDPEDLELVKHFTPPKEKVHEFCSQYSGEAYHACHRESWPRFQDEIKAGPEGLIQFCSYTSHTEDQKQWEQCYVSLMNFVGASLIVPGSSLEKLRTYCNGLPITIRGLCYGHAARRVIQLDPKYYKTAIEVCNISAEAGLDEECFKWLVYYVKKSFHEGSTGLMSICADLPGKWKLKCLRP